MGPSAELYLLRLQARCGWQRWGRRDTGVAIAVALPLHCRCIAIAPAPLTSRPRAATSEGSPASPFIALIPRLREMDTTTTPYVESGCGRDGCGAARGGRGGEALLLLLLLLAGGLARRPFRCQWVHTHARMYGCNPGQR